MRRGPPSSSTITSGNAGHHQASSTVCAGGRSSSSASSTSSQLSGSAAKPPIIIEHHYWSVRESFIIEYHQLGAGKDQPSSSTSSALSTVNTRVSEEATHHHRVSLSECERIIHRRVSSARCREGSTIIFNIISVINRQHQGVRRRSCITTQRH